MNKKIKHLEEVNKMHGDEILKQKLETNQWKKTTKDIVSIIAEGTRKALDDYTMATYLYHGFLKICLIARNYHLVRGELDEALCFYKKCLDSRMVCLDRRLTIKESDGLQSVEYEEVVQMCEQTLAITDKNYGNINDTLLMLKKTEEPSLFSATIVHELHQMKVTDMSKMDENEARRTKSSTGIGRVQENEAEGKTLLTSSDTWDATLAIPSTLIGGRDVENDQRLRFDGLESRAMINEVGSVSWT
ncbi:hypothetical protein Tco_0290890 [Tanacetum coccineum]